MFTKKDLIYHRGKHGPATVHDQQIHIPENSLDAFRAAIDDGAVMIEFDARKNPHGTMYDPIIAHDNDARAAAPTVIEALDVAQARCNVNIEIKDPAIWTGIMSLVNWYVAYDGWSPEQFLISSFHHPTVIQIKKRHPQFQVGAIMDGIPLLPYLTTLRRHGVDNLHMEYMNADMDKQRGSPFMNKARKLGMNVWVWTVNDIATAERVFDWGAKRIFTDRPHLFST